MSDPFGDDYADLPETGDDGMTDAERALAEALYGGMMESMRRSDRSKQAQEFRVGVSDLGYCSERLRRFLDRQVPEDTDMLAAFHGTWLGAGLEQASLIPFPNAILQSEVSLTLHGDTNTYEVPGHPDIILPEGILLDGKSSNGLNDARRAGMEDLQKKFQRHCYGVAAYNQGLFNDDVALEDIQVGNAWIDRSAEEKRLLVKLEPLDLDVIEQATAWLDEVVYAWQHNQEAPKEPAREVCAATCGFFSVCRAYDTDVQGLLTDPTVLRAVEMKNEGTILKREAERLLKEAKSNLDNIAGSTGEYTVRWIDVPPSEIKGFTRAGYRRLDVRKIK